MANYLADRRMELGLTQKEVAAAVGVAEATISRWESGDIANMRRNRISALAKVLDVSPTYIMEGPQSAENAFDGQLLAMFHNAPENIQKAVLLMLSEYRPGCDPL